MNNEPRWEYGLRIDCEKNGCNPPHRDDKVVHRVSMDELKEEYFDARLRTLNGHATTLVRRLIGVWEEDTERRAGRDLHRRTVA